MGQMVDLLLVVIFSIVIFLIALDISLITNKRTDCLKNPLSYGVQQWESKLGKEMVCSCMVVGTPETLYVNNKSLYTSSPLITSQLNSTNFSYG